MDNALMDSAKKKKQVTDIVVRVDAVEEPRPFGDEKIVYLKFMVATEKALRIQCMVLENQIQRIRSFVKRNKIIHIKGATSKKELNLKYNDGDVPFILMIDSNTIIKLIKDCDSDDEKEEQNFVTTSSNSSFGSLITRYDSDHLISVINDNTTALRELAAALSARQQDF